MRSTTFLDMDNSEFKDQRASRNNSVMWLDQETLDIIFAFVGEGGLDDTFIEVVPS